MNRSTNHLFAFGAKEKEKKVEFNEPGEGTSSAPRVARRAK